MTNAFETFDLTPKPNDQTYGDYELAHLEGSYALHMSGDPEATITPEDLAKRYALIAELDTRIEEEENPFIEPESAIYALRVAMRLLINKGGTQEERDEALKHIGWALRTIEIPE